MAVAIPTHNKTQIPTEVEIDTEGHKEEEMIIMASRTDMVRSHFFICYSLYSGAVCRRYGF